MSSSAEVMEGQVGAASASHMQKAQDELDRARSSNSEGDISAKIATKTAAASAPSTTVASESPSEATAQAATVAAAAAAAMQTDTTKDTGKAQATGGLMSDSYENDTTADVESAADSTGVHDSGSISTDKRGGDEGAEPRAMDGDEERAVGNEAGEGGPHEEHSHRGEDDVAEQNGEEHKDEQGGKENGGGEGGDDAASGGEGEEGDDDDDEDEDEDEDEDPSATVISGHTIQFSLRQVNPFLVCRLCAGYLINATTLSECLHTFCKSCIVEHFDEGNKACPVCGQIAHEINPHETLRQDRTMQSIVYKLVPGLLEEEERREREFEAASAGTEHDGADEAEASDTDDDHSAKRPKIVVRKNDPQVSFMLEPQESKSLIQETSKEDESAEGELDRPFIRTSSRATVMHLKKFLARKLGLSSPEDVDVLCRGEVLGKEYTLEYVLRTRWRKPSQLMLRYRPRIDIQAAS